GQAISTRAAYLMHEAVLGVMRKCFPGRWIARIIDVDGCGGLGLDDGEPGAVQPRERIVDVFERHREMAEVEADADPGPVDVGETFDRVGRGLDRTSGFRLETDADRAPGRRLQLVEGFCEFAEVTDSRRLPVGEPRRVPSEGKRRDAPTGGVVGQ